MTWPYECLIGLRYLRARRRRTLSFSTAISVGGITLGVAALIATLAVMTGFKEDIREKILSTNAHIIVADRTGAMLPDHHALRVRLEQTPHVVAATPFIYNQVLISSEFSAHGVLLRGIDPATEGRVTGLPRHLVLGEMSALTTPPPPPTPPHPTPSPSRGEGRGDGAGRPLPGLFLGRELAARLGVTIGEPVQILSTTGTLGPFGIVPKVRRFRVAGIFEFGMYEYDANLAFTSLAAAQDFFAMGETVSGIEVKVDDIFQADRIAEAIQARLGFPYSARDWMKSNRNLFSALKLEKTMMFIILVLIIIVASFNIVSTLMMIVVEKGREIGILISLGATRRAIMRIFIFDGLLIGLLGVALGIPLGLAVCAILQQVYTLPAEIYYVSRLPVRLRAMDVALVAVSALTISFLATLYPAWRAARMNPAEALRYE